MEDKDESRTEPHTRIFGCTKTSRFLLDACPQTGEFVITNVNWVGRNRMFVNGYVRVYMRVREFKFSEELSRPLLLVCDAANSNCVCLGLSCRCQRSSLLFAKLRDNRLYFSDVHHHAQCSTSCSVISFVLLLMTFNHFLPIDWRIFILNFRTFIISAVQPDSYNNQAPDQWNGAKSRQAPARIPNSWQFASVREADQRSAQRYTRQ